jgi:hypothetical protein
MRDDIPEWLGKPPRRGSEAWANWLEKWRQYARQELRDTTCDDPEFDFGLLSEEERWRVGLGLEIRKAIALGQSATAPALPISRKVSDHLHASAVAWLVGRSVRSPIPDETFQKVGQWVGERENPRRRRIAHGIRYGFIAGIGGEAATPSWSTPEYVIAYEAAWEMGNAIAIEQDPRG